MRGSSSAARGLVFGGFLLLASAALAGLNQWTDVGPAEGALAFAIDPTDSSILYAGNGAGIQKSVDGGRTWSPLAIGFTAPVTEIGIDPENPAVVYAASSSASRYSGSTSDGIYKSKDSGQTWTRVHSTAPVGSRVVKIRSLSVFPSVVLAGTEHWICVSDACLSGNPVTLRSGDGGVTWDDVGPDFPALAFDSDPVSPSTIYMGTGRVSSFFGDFSGGLFRSLDGGLRWHARNRGVDLKASGSFLSVATAPATPSVLYAGSEKGGVLKSTDGAANWAPMDAMRNQHVAALAVDPVDSSRVYAGTLTGVLVSDDAGSSWVSYGPPGAEISQLSLDPADRRTLYAISGGRLMAYTFAPGACVPGDQTLCLNDGRFRVEVDWHAVNQGTNGPGHAVELTSDSGAFWFFQETNLELMVKILDATSFSGYYWVFYGALSDVEYTIRVTDTQTGTTKSYFNPQGNLASHADTSAFPGSAGAPLRTAPAADARVATLGAAACQAGPAALCLTDSRFRVEVSWQTATGTGVGTAVPLTSDSVTFWFFQETNLELMVKVLDARAIDDHFWVFYGALSDVAYTITITDTESGAVRTYENPAGTLASVADTSAF
jgi:photosystem II stability/assembly factor-like uncharacterized protein